MSDDSSAERGHRFLTVWAPFSTVYRRAQKHEKRCHFGLFSAPTLANSDKKRRKRSKRRRGRTAACQRSSGIETSGNRKRALGPESDDGSGA